MPQLVSDVTDNHDHVNRDGTRVHRRIKTQIFDDGTVTQIPDEDGQTDRIERVIPQNEDRRRQIRAAINNWPTLTTAEKLAAVRIALQRILDDI